MRFLWIACLLLSTLTTSRPSQAQNATPERVSVLTMGPGDHPFARFGHNAILLEWTQPPHALVYNFGTFAFDGLQGVKDFMAGRFRYWLSVSTLSRTLRFYRAQNRSVVTQELNLDPAERKRLAAALETNALPEHRFYDYDYYYDNCSTRVRDVVARALGGELERSLQGSGRYTFREHTERLTADAPALYFGLDLALGPMTDRPIARWDELFVPGELQSALRHSVRQIQGREEPVVRAERVLATADRPPSRSEPPARVPLYAGIGTLLGVAVSGLGRWGRKQVAARFAFGLLVLLLGFVLGLLGNVFVVFWAFTKHWSAYRNENLLVCPPWALLLAVTAVGLALGRAKLSAFSHQLIRLSALSAALALVLALIPGFGQDNTRTVALFAPLWFGVYAGSTWLHGKALW